MYNVIYLNDRLYHLKLEETQMSDFCKKHKQNYEHVFKECEHANPIWTHLFNVFGYSFEDLHKSLRIVILIW